MNLIRPLKEGLRFLTDLFENDKKTDEEIHVNDDSQEYPEGKFFSAARFGATSATFYMNLNWLGLVLFKKFYPQIRVGLNRPRWPSSLSRHVSNSSRVRGSQVRIPAPDYNIVHSDVDGTSLYVIPILERHRINGAVALIYNLKVRGWHCGLAASRTHLAHFDET